MRPCNQKPTAAKVSSDIDAFLAANGKIEQVAITIHQDRPKGLTIAETRRAIAKDNGKHFMPPEFTVTKQARARGGKHSHIGQPDGSHNAKQ